MSRARERKAKAFGERMRSEGEANGAIAVELGGFRPSVEQLEAIAEDHAAIAAGLRAQITARRAAGKELN